MNIKGFKAKDGTVYQYDYNELANLPETPEGEQGADGGGLSTTAVNLLMDVLNAAQYHTNVSGKIEQLREALLSGAGSGGTGGGDTPDEPDEPVVVDEITVSDGIMTIVAVGSAITVSDGVMTIA